MASLVTAAALLSTCDRDSASAWRGTIDRLPNGATVVRSARNQTWSPASSWRLREDLRIGPADHGPASFAYVYGLAVDQHGRIYILDSEAQEVRVFGSSGAFVHAVGRRGHGPGEFVQANGLAWDPRRSWLWVVDHRGERYSAFDTAGRLVMLQPRRFGFWGGVWKGSIDTVGRLYDDAFRPDADRRAVLVRFDTAFARRDTFDLPWRKRETFVLRYLNGYAVVPVPFAPTLLWRLTSTGDLWFGMNTEYRIVLRRLSGDTVRIIERAYEPIPVEPGEVDSAVGWVQKYGRGAEMDAGRIPRVKPAFEAIFPDDAGRLWVKVPTRHGERGARLDVFDADGRYLGPVRTSFNPVPWASPIFRADTMYAVAQDDDGVNYVVRVRISRDGAR
jgi:6-bladed beta-propeller